MLSAENYQVDKRLNLGIIITLGISMLCPEYIAPIFLFATFIYFKRLFSKTNRKALLGTMGKVLFVHMCYMLVSAIWSKTTLMSILVPLMWMGCFLGYVLLSNALNKEEKINNAVTAVNISAGLIGLMAIVEIVTFNLTKYVDWFNYKFPNPFYWHINDKFFDLLPIDVTNYIFASRASATFDNPLILATYLVVCIPFCAFGSVYFHHSRNRKISRVCLLFAIGGTICTSSRASYIAIGLSIVVMLLSSKKLFKKLFPFLIALLVTVPIGLYLRFKNTPIGDFLASNTQRFNIWKDCFEMFTQNPIIGLGAGTENIHTLLRDTYGINRHHAHSVYLEMFVEGGIIGGAFMITLIVLIIKNIIKLYKMKEERFRNYASLYAASFAAFATMSVSEFTLQSAKELMTFFFLAGFLEATVRIAENKEQLAEDELPDENIKQADYALQAETVAQ